MSDTTLTKLQNAVPVLRSKWWTFILVLSLMANLLVAGAVIGRNMHMKEFGGPMKANFVQLIPRKFFDQLPDPRRKELMKMLRDNRDEFKTMREESSKAALDLASALESQTYDAASVKALIEKFTTGRESLAGKAGAVVIEIIDKLTPQERSLLSASIRERNAHGWK
jgi:uncharacterized membrane protein